MALGDDSVPGATVSTNGDVMETFSATTERKAREFLSKHPETVRQVDEHSWMVKDYRVLIVEGGYACSCPYGTRNYRALCYHAAAVDLAREADEANAEPGDTLTGVVTPLDEEEQDWGLVSFYDDREVGEL